jgi:hypothetical protein
VRRSPAKKLTSQGGMTLFETLAAVAVLALLSSMILAGSQAAMSAARKNTFASECQTVSDTINTALSDPLRYATDITTDGAGVVTAYTSPDYQISGGKITVGTDTDAEGISNAGLIYLDAGKLLLKGAAYSSLEVVPADFQAGDPLSGEFLLNYDNATHVFTGSYKLYDPVSKLMSKTCSFTFQTVNSVEAQRG